MGMGMSSIILPQNLDALRWARDARRLRSTTSSARLNPRTLWSNVPPPVGTKDLALAAAAEPSMRAPIRVGLFVTCLVDLIRPSVGFAAVKLLEDAGCYVFVPSQTCCGQPAYNSGDRATTKDIARQVMAAFADCDYVVAPSGSCAGMLAKHYAELFAGEPEMAAR